MKLEMKICGS